MAKQTFTTGQVLTAAQMTSLQQTAMLGGAASAKTASYTLVAADAGTAISMSNASATTITVNTALFAAGDTVQITNLGAGVCTITAGTATVNTASSLALAQYESGTLDFTSTSAAIFIKGAGAVAASGGMTLISTTAITNTSLITLSSIPATYKTLQVVIRGAMAEGDNDKLRLQFNTDVTGSRYRTADAVVTLDNATYNDNNVELSPGQDNNSSTNLIVITVPDYTNTTTIKMAISDAVTNNATTNTNINYKRNVGFYKQTPAISSISLFMSSSNFYATGSILLYGVS